MTAFLARLDGLLIKALSSGSFTAFLIWVSDQSVRVEDWMSRQETRWQKRTPKAARPRGRHRLQAGSCTRERYQEARADDEWAMAVKRMARRMEGSWAVWC